jgi:hypothetical protein
MQLMPLNQYPYHINNKFYYHIIWDFKIDGPRSHTPGQMPLKPELGNYQGQYKAFDDVPRQKNQCPGLNSQAYGIRFSQHQVHIERKIWCADAIDNKCTGKCGHEYRYVGKGFISHNTPHRQRGYYKTY